MIRIDEENVFLGLAYRLTYCQDLDNAPPQCVIDVPQAQSAHIRYNHIDSPNQQHGAELTS